MARFDRALTAAVALLISALGFLPIANWISGGPAIPAWSDLIGGWWSGTMLVLGAAVVLTLLTRKLPVLPGQDLPARLARSFAASPRLWSVSVAVLALLLYLWIARAIFSAKPLLVDEIV